MNDINENSLICDNCNNIVKSDDNFCPECGALFLDEISCDNHKDILAEGSQTAILDNQKWIKNDRYACFWYNAIRLYYLGNSSFHSKTPQHDQGTISNLCKRNKK